MILELLWTIIGNLGRRLAEAADRRDRKSTRLNSSHSQISYAVFCLKKKNAKLYGFSGSVRQSEIASPSASNTSNATLHHTVTYHTGILLQIKRVTLSALCLNPKLDR